jgi:leucyl aminopeptidase (aminopeptidase T)
MNLEQASIKILKDIMGVKSSESVLIIADKNKLDIGKALVKEAQKIASGRLLRVPVGKINGEEPSEIVAAEMLKYGVILIATTKSLSHTNARRNAVKKGARLASMPGITESMLIRAAKADYETIAKNSEHLMALLNKGNQVIIEADNGTNLSLSVKGRELLGESGILNEKGMWGNLPAGEVCCAPVEGTTQGTLVIDGSVLGKKLETPIKVFIKDGYAVNFEGNDVAQRLKNTLATVGKDAFAIAELGIGTNNAAIITGNTLEDEKVLGTAHIAFGNNKSYGGSIDVPVHIDGVFMKPTIFVDAKKIINKGQLL